jgi:hypothetical protein
MKKLIAIIGIILLFVAVGNAQRVVAAASGTTTSLGVNESIIKITTTASDTVGGTAVKYWLIQVNKPKLQLYSFVINIDTIRTTTRGEGNRLKVQIYGSLDGSTFTQVGSTIWYNVNAGTNADSTFAVSDVATGVLWKYFKVQYTGVVAAKCSKPTLMILKVADK